MPGAPRWSRGRRRSRPASEGCAVRARAGGPSSRRMRGPARRPRALALGGMIFARFSRSASASRAIARFIPLGKLNVVELDDRDLDAPLLGLHVEDLPDVPVDRVVSDSVSSWRSTTARSVVRSVSGMQPRPSRNEASSVSDLERGSASRAGRTGPPATVTGPAMLTEHRLQQSEFWYTQWSVRRPKALLASGAVLFDPEGQRGGWLWPPQPHRPRADSALVPRPTRRRLGRHRR
jgi:hypothetical protein